MNGISFTGRETMLTAGIKKSAKASFFKGDVPSEAIKNDDAIMKALDNVSRTDFIKADYPISTSVKKAVKDVKNPSVESYINAHKPIVSEASSLSHDSAVSGENIHFFG